MLKILLALCISITSLMLSGCTATGGGLQSYVSGSGGYQFLYPNGWTKVEVKRAGSGVDVVFHDLIEIGENLSVIVNPVPDNKTLEELGTPSEVGYKILKNNSLNPNGDREIDLIKAESREENGKNYYILEYAVKTPDAGERHNLASVAISKGKLYSFNVSTSEKRWDRIHPLFENVVNSFSVY